MPRVRLRLGEKVVERTFPVPKKIDRVEFWYKAAAKGVPAMPPWKGPGGAEDGRWSATIRTIIGHGYWNTLEWEVIIWRKDGGSI